MMKKKAGKKKTSTKKTQPPAKRGSELARTSKQQLLNKQPQSKQQAAVAHGMFLYTDDA